MEKLTKMQRITPIDAEKKILKNTYSILRRTKETF